jgi:hypothetical protein
MLGSETGVERCKQIAHIVRAARIDFVEYCVVDAKPNH